MREHGGNFMSTHAWIRKQTLFPVSVTSVRPQKYCDLETIKRQFKQTCESVGIPL